LFADKGLHEATALTVDEAIAWFGGLLTGPQDKVRDPLLREILHRLRFLQEVGLGYLTLDRPAPTLSGGEVQRARLATHLGTGLLGVCYILDEPTIGLHPRDTDRLIRALRELQRRGNTVIVVEHDEAVIRQADFLVDMGPGAGKQGGRVLAYGTVAQVLGHSESVTGRWLAANPSPSPSRGRKPPEQPPESPGAHAPGSEQSPGAHAPGSEQPPETARSARNAQSIQILGARHNNLKNITVTIPLGHLVCVTGVSGTGKSSLVHDILASAVRHHLGLKALPPGAHERISGLEHIDKLIEVDQAPLGRSSRSSPATYTGVYDEIRRVYARTREAKVRGYTASRFSFNVRGGRCEECQGQGFRKVALHFLPDLTVPCPLCRGRRFNPATLAIHYRGKSIADVLDLSVADVRAFFDNFPLLVRPLQALVDVGLGYLTLGQPSSTLSGGEAQRVKLAAELARTATGKTLFLLDEPTTGLHFVDVANLLGVLRQLVERGNTLVVIEHHLDVIRAADWVIDLGADGGAAGGYVMAMGPPAEVAGCPASATGQYLRGLASEPAAP
jgi:excinuclease ABC subunit A